MKFLHLADLHLGKRVNGFDLLEDQRYILEQILALCDSNKVDAVVLAGDIYDAPVPPAPPADPVIAEMDDKAAVSNGDWELLERIFSRKK